MTDTYIASYIRALPKAELHLNIEGTWEPENVSLAYKKMPLNLKEQGQNVLTKGGC